MELVSLDRTLEKLQPPSQFTICTQLLGNWWRTESLWEHTPLVTRIASAASGKAEKTTNTRSKVSRLRQTRISLDLTASTLSPIMSNAQGTTEDVLEAHTGALKQSKKKKKSTVFENSKTMFSGSHNQAPLLLSVSFVSCVGIYEITGTQARKCCGEWEKLIRWLLSGMKKVPGAQMSHM